MGEVRPIPTLGGVVQDVRGAGRALRVSWHHEDGLVVLSLWNGPRCTGTVRVAAADVPALVEALQIGLRPEPVARPAPETSTRDPENLTRDPENLTRDPETLTRGPEELTGGTEDLSGGADDGVAG